MGEAFLELIKDFSFRAVVAEVLNSVNFLVLVWLKAD
jgi:hypothetical protein